MANTCIVIDAVGSPMGRSKNGVFRNVRAEYISTNLINVLFERKPGAKASDVKDVIWGRVNLVWNKALTLLVKFL
jgi:acetyl-CoA acyltransferase